MVEQMLVSHGDTITIKNIHKYYGAVHVLQGVSLNVKKGEIVAIVGPSGSGKSTLIRTINCLERIQSGQIYINNTEVTTSTELGLLRQKIGLVSQEFNLFPHLTVKANVTLAPNKVLHWRIEKCNVIAEQLLQKMNLWEQAEKFPGELSGGERQRACIARALAMQPEIMLFDESTSALDAKTTDEILKIIKELAASGLSILIVTHTKCVEKIANKVFILNSGKLAVA